MKVILPKEARGAEILAAIKRAGERTGFSLNPKTCNAFTAGSVKEVPLSHAPVLKKKTGRFWATTSIEVGGGRAGWTGWMLSSLKDDASYDSIEVRCMVPLSNPVLATWEVSDTNSRDYPKAEPYLKEFLGAFFEEMEAIRRDNAV